MKQTLKMRILAMLLAVIMVVGVIPATVFATEAETGTEIEAPTEEPVEEPAEEPGEEPVEEPAEEPVEEPAEEPGEEPVEEPAEEPVEEPGEEPIEKPIEDSLEELAPIDVTASAPVLTGATTGSPEIVYTTREDDYYKVITKDDYILAPGITESEIVLNNADGSHRQVAHVVEIDINNSYTKVMPSYKRMAEGLEAKDYGVQVMSQQVAYAEANGYGNVVAAMNLSLSWYNSTYYANNPGLVGEPLGYLFMDGVQYTNSQGQTGGAQTCLVINFDEKDGVARPADMPKTEIRSTSSAITGWEEQVIPANFGFLVKDGVNQYGENHTSDPASRSFVGIKADGSIIMVMNDGRLAPYSIGFNSYEMAEFMLSLGCVQAVNGDGGGSSAFLSQRPGEELALNCTPSDGAERPTTHGILVISTAPSNGTFVRAQISAPDDFYTPGSSVQFSAVGADLVGGAAEIPAEASWQLEDPTLGTIDANGLFVSNGNEGEVVAQMIYNGEVVGEDTINVVVPESLEFVQSNITAPYGKTVTLDIVAKYGYNEVVLKSGDVVYTLSDENMGTLNGNVFTATSDESLTSGSVTATLAFDSAVAASANVAFGKASEIVYDFEAGPESVANLSLGYKNATVIPENYNFSDTFEVVSAADGGKVKNGQYALKITSIANSITMMGWCQTRFNGWNIDLTDAVSLSFWMYIPEGSHGIEWDLGAAIPVNLGHEFKYGTGWQYFTVNVADMGTNVTNLDRFTLYHSDTSCTATQYDHAEHPNYYSDVVYYIDDITVNYSTAVEDFDPPVISEVLLSHEGTDIGLEMNGQQIENNVVTVTAKAADNKEKSNYTGLDASSLKMYVDGNQVAASCNASGIITSSNLELANGMHTFRIEISDNRGNTTYVEKQIEIAAAGNTKNTVKLAPKDDTLKNLLSGSVYWLDLTATAIEKVQKLDLVIDLDNNSDWELDHMVLAEGFAATYAVEAETNTVTLSISKTGDTAVSAEAVLASIPVRVWEPQFAVKNEDANSYRLVAVEAHIEKGLLTETDDNQEYVGSEKLSTVTEFNGTRLNNGEKIGYHSHTPEAVENEAATCIKAGYIDRTFCTECNSVVDWGTVTPATGHSFEVTADGIYTCDDCGKTFCYIDGARVSGWQEIEGATYYFDEDGAANGETIIDGITYIFADYKLTAPALVSDGVAQIGYWAGKQLEGGWHTLNGNKYFVVGIYVSTGISKVALSTDKGYRWYAFDENGVWQENHNGLYDDGDEIIYAENGVAVYKGLVQDAEGNYYYINSSCKAVRNCVYGIGEAKTNGLLPAGKYTFGEDAKMINPPTAEPDEPDTPEEPVVKQGLVKDEDGEIRYYKDGVAQYAGVVADAEGNLYYINSSKKAVKDCKYGISEARTNGLIPAGVYYFDAEGKMIDPPTAEPDEPDTPEEPVVKQGLVKDDDGEIRYYVDGVATYAGVVKDDEGNLYYINSTKKAVKNCKYGIGAAKTNGLIPAGIYQIDADGRIIVE